VKRIFAVFYLAVALSAVTSVIAEDEYTISGDLAYQKEATIYVCLHNQQTYPEWKKTLPPSSFTQTVKANPSGKATFVFRDVPKGGYLIVAFADENGKGKLDVDTFGHALESWWVYKQTPPGGSGINWYDQKFEVEKDVTGVTLK
jgi:uncharacterized protein (DUF2141 family)